MTKIVQGERKRKFICSFPNHSLIKDYKTITQSNKHIAN